MKLLQAIVYRTYVNWYGGCEHITFLHKQHLFLLEKKVREFLHSFLTELLHMTVIHKPINTETLLELSLIDLMVLEAS